MYGFTVHNGLYIYIILWWGFFHIRTVHSDIIEVLHYSPTDAQVSRLKTKLKFTLKQLQHVDCTETCHSCFNVNIKPFKDKAQTALFKDPVRTAL